MSKKLKGYAMSMEEVADRLPGTYVLTYEELANFDSLDELLGQ